MVGAMTDDELKAIEARAYSTHVAAFDRDSAIEALSRACISQMDVPTLIAEVRRLRKGMRELPRYESQDLAGSLLLASDIEELLR